jgi:hypothetical protein
MLWVTVEIRGRQPEPAMEPPNTSSGLNDNKLRRRFKRREKRRGMGRGKIKKSDKEVQYVERGWKKKQDSPLLGIFAVLLSTGGKEMRKKQKPTLTGVSGQISKGSRRLMRDVKR